MRKRLLSFLLVLCMVLALLPGTALAWIGDTVTWDWCGNKVSWELYSDGQLEISCGTYSGEMTDYAVPSRIYPPWYDYKLDVKSITISSESVKNIGRYAFYECSNLTRVSISEGVTKIGMNAFDGCNSLTDVYFNGSEAQWHSIEIGDHNDDLLNAKIHFNSGICGPDLTWVLGSNGELTISGTGSMNRYSYAGGYSPWSQNDQITGVIINPGVTSISECSFIGCNSLTSIAIPISVTTIGFWAFSGTALSHVYYEGNEAQWKMLSIDDGADDMGHPFNDEILNSTIHYNSTGPAPTEPETPNIPAFTDVSATAYYADAVNWAVENGVTSGTGNGAFSPENNCTRAQIVTFLYRAVGEPVVAMRSSFTDVPSDSYYADAVAWAVEKGVTSGTGGGAFSPNANCTRAQIVTFLWRAAGKPAATGRSSFTDVLSDSYYADAVAWAVEKGITSGTGTNTFSPDTVCTRGQSVTFLYRCRDIDLIKGDSNNDETIEFNKNYEYVNGEFVSVFSVNNNGNVKNAELMFWHNYGLSSSDEDFFFEWEDGKWEYTVLGNRAHKYFLLTFTPTAKGMLIKVACLEGTYFSWENFQSAEVWINAEYEKK